MAGRTSDIFDLSGRVALVTGGAGHIGSAIAAALAERGARLAIADRTSRYISGGGVLVSCHFPHVWGAASDTSHVLDLAETGAVQELADAIKSMHGRLDILVNCAGLTAYPTGLDVPFPEQTAEAWDACMAVNLRAPFLLTQACLPMLRASGHGSVINIASIYGMVGPDLSLYEGTAMGNSAAYAASKAGLIGLTRHLATRSDVVPVRVNAISPGGVERGQDPEFRRRYEARVPLGRMATERDIVGAAVYLASDASAYVTGQNIAVDGGWTAW